MGFVSEVLQVDSCDKALRVSLYNLYIQLQESIGKLSAPRFGTFRRYVWAEFFLQPISEYHDSYFSSKVRDLFNEGEWFRIYDFYEVIFEILQYAEKDIQAIELLAKETNDLLLENGSGYRFIKETLRFVPIISDSEIECIEDAISATKDQFSGAHEHIRNALAHMSDRENPHYDSSFQQSIAGLESVCVKLCDGQESSLGKALKCLQKRGGYNIPKMLFKAFEDMYAYSNDTQSGVRHYLERPSEIELEDARYWLVTCSAFINLLIDKANKLSE